MACSTPRAARCAQLAQLAQLALSCGLLALAGCASTLDVRTLATARADQSAFELTGHDLAALRRQAGLLCPQGGEILRQTAREQQLEAVDNRLERWVHVSSRWITPPERHAQLVVLCQPVTERHLLAAGSLPPALAGPLPGSPASAPGAVAASAANLSSSPSTAPSTVPHAASAAPRAPIGPLSVEW